jgi:predicted permease
MAITLLAAWFIGTRVLKLSRPAVGSLMICAGLANTGYLGLPFCAALFDHDEFANAVAYDATVSGITFVSVGFTIGAAFGSVASGVGERLWVLLTRSPPLWAAAAGLLAPDSVAPSWTLDAVRIAVVVILIIGCFAVGVTLSHESADGVAPFPPPLSAPVAVAVGLKVALPPFVLFVLGHAFLPVPDPYYVQAAMPAAINSVIVANTYGLDRALAAAAIAWGTGLAVVAGVVVSLV